MAVERYHPNTVTDRELADLFIAELNRLRTNTKATQIKIAVELDYAKGSPVTFSSYIENHAVRIDEPLKEVRDGRS